MSKIQLHAYIVIAILGLALLATKAVKPLALEGRPNTKFQKIPLELKGWVGSDARFDEQTYKLLPTCSLLLRYYEHEDAIAPVELVIVYGTDLGDFHQPEMCLEGQGLRTIEKKKVRIKGDNGSFDAVSLLMENDYGRKAFIFWFSSKRSTSTFLGDYKVKVFLKRLLDRKSEPSALVRMSTDIYDTEEEATARLIDFADEVTPYLELEFAEGNLEEVSQVK